MKQWNWLLGLAFHTLVDYKKAGAPGIVWPSMVTPHLAISSPLMGAVGEDLYQKRNYTVSQLTETDNITGRLTTDYNRALMADLAPCVCTVQGAHSRQDCQPCHHRLFPLSTWQKPLSNLQKNNKDACSSNPSKPLTYMQEDNMMA